jgi:glycine/D-amino acid oxidase-like deaminating enzyme
MKKNRSIAILGAGISGVSSAYYLSKLGVFDEIILIDKLQPLSFTTSCSGENFREYWPQPMMNRFIGHSIDLMKAFSKDCDNCFNMKYSGYDFVTHKDNHSIFPLTDKDSGEIGDIQRLEDHELIQKTKPYLDDSVKAVEHINKAGSIEVYALGSMLLKLARQNGVKLLTEEVVELDRTASSQFKLSFESGASLETTDLLLASGPFIQQHAKSLGYELPIYNIKQRKFVFKDTKQIIPRDMPFTIYADSQYLQWNPDEEKLMNEYEEYHWLLEEFPAGLHIKPEGQDQIKMGWAYNQQKEQPQWDIFADDEFVSVVLKGASRFIPAISAYAVEIPTSVTHFAGYYTRTDDNLPVMGELEQGLYVSGAFAGYGTMAGCASGELMAEIITNQQTPEYLKYFSPDRFENATLMEEISQYPSGQL